MVNPKDKEKRDARCLEETQMTQVVRGGIFGDLAVSTVNGKMIHVEIKPGGRLKKRPY